MGVKLKKQHGVMHLNETDTRRCCLAISLRSVICYLE